MATKDLVKKRESLPSVFNDFFRPWESVFDLNGGSMFNNLNPINMPAVNISETKDQYEVSLAVPGMKKEDFNIDVEGSTLTISAEITEENEDKEERFNRKEYSYTSFTRSFTLPDWVIKDKINAGYENGLLKVVLPKTEAAKQAPSKHITVK